MNPTQPTERLWVQAITAFRQRRLPAAADACTKLLRLAPLHSAAHSMLATIALQTDERRDATNHALASTTSLAGQPAEFVASVVNNLVALGESEHAHATATSAGLLNAASPQALAELARLLGLIDCHEDALRLLDLAVQRGGDADTLWYLRGNTLKFLGRTAEALLAYEVCLERSPGNGRAHFAIAGMGAPQGAELRISRLRSLVERTQESSPESIHLHFSLFKELDAIDETAAAWRALQAGCAAKRRRLRYDAVAEANDFSRLIDVAKDWQATQAHNISTPLRPIFIVGLPRSGTTLLERIIGGNSDVTNCGELNDFRNQMRWCINHACDGFLDQQTLAGLETLDYNELGDRYHAHVAWRLHGKRYFTDKKPGNFMLVGPILRALPNARIIHLRRNAMDSCFSNLKELFGETAHPYSYDLIELAEHFRNYRRLMQSWNEYAGPRLLHVDYEALIEDPSGQTERIMDFCGLPYSPKQLRIEDNTAAVSTASAIQVRQPISRRHIGAWKRYERWLQPLQERLIDEPSP